MGNNQIQIKSDPKAQQMSQSSSHYCGNGFQSKNMSSEYEQCENSLKNVFQKEIFKKSINEINNKLMQLQNHINVTPKLFNSNENLKQKPSFTSTLFDKQKIKKITNKVIEQEAIISCETIRYSQQKQNKKQMPPIQTAPIFKPILISQESIFKIKNIKIHQKYHLTQIIGEGGFGVVYKAECLTTHQYRAVKVLQLKKYTEYEKTLILNEIRLIAKLDHPNIIKIYEIIENDTTFFIVTEYCEGGCLTEYIKAHKPANIECFAKIVTHKILSALKYMHSKHIMHRDIKLQNIVMKRMELSGKEQVMVKLIDFGLAVEYRDNKVVRSEKIIGTPQYLAPQCTIGSHYPQSDVWSCGVLLHLLLTGNFPFKARTKTEMISKIKKECLNIKQSSQLNKISKEARDLLSKMLTKNHSHRITAEEALCHPWFDQQIKKKRDLLSHDGRKSSQIAQELLNFERKNNLVTFLDVYTILTKLNEFEREKLIVYFNLIDKNHNGVIEYNELSDYFQSSNLKLSEYQAKAILRKLDLNNSQTIYLNEFIYAITNIEQYYQKQYMQQLFQLFDTNRDGYIDKKQLQLVLSQCNNQEIQYFMQIIGKKFKKKFNFEEFRHYIKSVRRRKIKVQ